MTFLKIPYDFNGLLIWIALSAFPVSIMAQKLTKSNQLTNYDSKFSPVEWFKVNSSFYLYQNFKDEYSQNSELRRFTKDLSPTKDIINLSEQGLGFTSLDVICYQDQILHVSEVETEDSISTFYQVINPVSNQKSSQYLISGYKKNNQYESDFSKTFYASQDKKKLCLVAEVEGRRFDKQALKVITFGENLKINAVINFDFKHPKSRMSFEEIKYADNGDLFVLSKINRSDDHFFEVYFLSARGNSVLLETIEHGDMPSMGFKDNGDFFLIKPYSSVPTFLTQGVKLSIYNKTTHELTGSNFHGFDLDFYLNLNSSRGRKKITIDHKNGNLLARDRILFPYFFEIGDSKIIVGYAKQQGTFNEKMFVFCFDAAFKLKWSEWFIATTGEIEITHRSNDIIVTFSGSEAYQERNLSQVGFMSVVVSPEGFTTPQKHMAYDDFHTPRLKKIKATSDIGEQLYYQLEAQTELNANKQNYWFYNFDVE